MNLAKYLPVDLDEVKYQCQIDPEDTEDLNDVQDRWLRNLWDACVEQADSYINRDFSKRPVPAGLRPALLMLMATFEQHRTESVSTESVGDLRFTTNAGQFVGAYPWHFEKMLYPFRKNPGL